MTRGRFLALALLLTSTASGAGYMKSFFGATPPGSWAQYQATLTNEDGKTDNRTQIVSRLPDQDGNVVVEIRAWELVNGKKTGKASVLQLHASPDFLDEQNPLNLERYIKRMITQVEGETAQELPVELMKQVGGASMMFDYSSNVEHVGDVKILGHDTSHYRTGGSMEMKVMIKSLKYDYLADLWMSAEVPFGRVKEHTVVRDSGGTIRSTTDMTLEDSGSKGAKSHLKGKVEQLEIPGMLEVAAADSVDVPSAHVRRSPDDSLSL